MPTNDKLAVLDLVELVETGHVSTKPRDIAA